METDKFITVLTRTYPYELAIIRGRLESEGISTFVQDELTIQVNPFYSNALGGVKLQVKESDLERTVEILKETGCIEEENIRLHTESTPAKSINLENQNEAKIICPFCGSEDVIQTKKRGWLFLLTSLFFMYPTPLFHKEYYCFNCEREVKPKS